MRKLIVSAIIGCFTGAWVEENLHFSEVSTLIHFVGIMLGVMLAVCFAYFAEVIWEYITEPAPEDEFEAAMGTPSEFTDPEIEAMWDRTYWYVSRNLDVPEAARAGKED